MLNILREMFRCRCGRGRALWLEEEDPWETPAAAAEFEWLRSAEPLAMAGSV